MTDFVHVSVLKQEILDFVITEDVKTVYDGTLGLGGHAKELMTQRPGIEKYIATDLDKRHLAFAKERLAPFAGKLEAHLSNFSAIGTLVDETAPRPLAIFLDLGICSVHVDDAERGFSFAADGPLNMSYDEDSELNAEVLLNEYSVDELIQVFRVYGEEPYAVKYAREIVKAREEERIKTTKQLAALIDHHTHALKRKKALMRVFQSIRIAVNQEMMHLEKVLEDGCALMKSGDRIGVISYHSLEDRVVKNYFKGLTTPKTHATEKDLHAILEPAAFRMITKKACKPTAEEITANPRSRSAVLRVLTKI
jgi:16S rRNA (cytosine1402-N4)-methyltransferase